MFTIAGHEGSMTISAGRTYANKMDKAFSCWLTYRRREASTDLVIFLDTQKQLFSLGKSIIKIVKSMGGFGKPLSRAERAKFRLGSK